MTIINWIKDHQVEAVLILIILLVGGFLRFYNVGEWVPFGQDEGRDAFVVRSIAQDGDIQLLGPAAPNNRTDFHLGPGFYYLLVPFYWLSAMSPAGGAWAIALFSFLSIFLVYLVGRNFFSWRAGLIAASLFSVSFAMVYYGRWSWNPNVVPFFALLIFLSLFKLTKLKENNQNSKYIFLLATAFGLIIQMHGTAMIVLPIILILFFIIFRPKISWKKYLLAILIVLVLNSPYIVYDLTNGFDNTRGFFQVLTQSDSNQSLGLWARLSNTYEVWQNFWHETLLHSQTDLLFFILFAGSIIYFLLKLWSGIKKHSASNILLLLWLVVPAIVFIFYKELIPYHYFCFIFPLPFLMLAYLFDYFWRNGFLKVIIVLVVLGLFGWQLFYSVQLLADLAPDGSRASSYPVTLSDMESAVNYVIEDSNGQPFNFISLPSHSYDRSYQYLFDNEGVIPSVIPEKLHYQSMVGKNGDNVFGNVIIIKTIY
ncbi:MAG: glycosyltransferase family 39 protein [bacterium]|nr:glycosyltransferase family 39 protein [bacterium]